ncbi:hypothetical protein AHF37_09951 [Paragonimus kellicotti]|nr:hypothetical protein AHF37_09951 [Paragonimus kellicotti]
MKPTEALITEMTSAFERFLSKFDDFGKVPKSEEIEEGINKQGSTFLPSRSTEFKFMSSGRTEKSSEQSWIKYGGLRRCNAQHRS